MRDSAFTSKQMLDDSPGSMVMFMVMIMARMRLAALVPAFVTVLTTTFLQHGIIGILLLRAPDITRFDEAGWFLSHPDLYQTDPDRMFSALSTVMNDDCEVSLHSLYLYKKILADELSVTMQYGNCLETGVLFTNAKGDWTTRMVPLSNIRDIFQTDPARRDELVVEYWDVNTDVRTVISVFLSALWYYLYQAGLEAL
jgi:hypothetical protein